MLNLFAAICVGIGGGFLGSKTRLPAGALLGSIMAVMLLGRLREQSFELPREYDIVCQALVGVIIAASFNTQLMRAVLRLWAPMVISCLTLMLAGLLVAVIMYKIGLMDFSNAYIASSPGAMNVLVSISGDMGADAAMVGAFHFVRVMIVSMSAPFIFKLFHHVIGLQ